MAVPVRRVVMASGNAGKLDEIRALLGDLNIEILPQSALGIAPAEETGSSFRENALIKARHAAALARLPAIADDSGLSVDALAGRPGVRSARFAGRAASDDENIDKLLAALEGVAERGASFHCVAVFAEPGGEAPLVASGEWRGCILPARRGRGGFGYDPVFLDPESGRSAAELSPALKNRVSHRGQAFRRLASLLAEHASGPP